MNKFKLDSKLAEDQLYKQMNEQTSVLKKMQEVSSMNVYPAADAIYIAQFFEPDRIPAA